MTGTPDDLTGTSFMAAEVADLYGHRPPYAGGAYAFILDNVPVRGRLLDLGCGEGKIARPMAKYFDQVVAVDPSAHMINLGKSLDNGDAANIHWLCARAEHAALKGRFDLVTFASSIHWMDPGMLFNKLQHHVVPDHLIAIVVGDEPFEPTWAPEFQAFLEKWVPKVTGRPLGSQEWQTSRTRHLDHLNVVLARDFLSDPFEQTIDGFVLCQQSRNTFARSKLGPHVSDFETELGRLLEGHTNDRGMLSYRVKTQVTLAKLGTPEA
ncbi:MAG: methyltransferase domain-containing protein [Pseudomonadota bacterium]